MKKVFAVVMSASLAFSFMLVPSFALEYDLAQDAHMYGISPLGVDLPGNIQPDQIYVRDGSLGFYTGSANNLKWNLMDASFSDLLSSSGATGGVTLYELEQLFQKYFGPTNISSSFIATAGQIYLDEKGGVTKYSSGSNSSQLDLLNRGLAGLGYLFNSKEFTVWSLGGASSLTFSQLIQYSTHALFVGAGTPQLDQNGSVVGRDNSISYLVSTGFLGLARRLMPDDGLDFTCFGRTYSKKNLLGGLQNINYVLDQSLAPDTSVLLADGSIRPSSLSAVGFSVGQGFSGLRTILGAPVSSVEYIDSSDPNLVNTSQAVDGYSGAFTVLGQRVQQDLAKLRFVLASDEDIQMRKDLKEQSNAVEQNFTKPGGAGTPSTDDIGALGDVSGAIGGYDPGVNIGDVIGQVNDSGTFKFLSKETQAALNPFYNYDSPAPAALSDDEFIDFLGQNTEALEALLGGGK